MKSLSEHQDFLIRRASKDEKYLGYTIDRYAQANSLEMDDIKKELGCGDEDFAKLLLCRNIDFSESNFPQQVRQIADFVDIEADKLSSLLKRIAVKSVFSQIQHGDALPPVSYLAAAREKEGNSDIKSWDESQ